MKTTEDILNERRNTHETDHWSDIIGYATLGGRLELAESLDNTSSLV